MGVTGWWAEIHKSFALAVTPSFGFNTKMSVPGAFGLALTPSIGMASAGVSKAAFGIAVTPEIGMSAVKTSFGLSITPSVGMSAAERYAKAFGLTVTPQVGMSASEQYKRTFDLSLTPVVGMAGKGKSKAAFGLSLTPSVGMAGDGNNGAATVLYDATGGGAAISSGTSLTWTHTAAGPVLVGVTYGAFSAITASAAYGGVAMTSLGRRAWNNTGNNWTELFLLSSPAAGPQSVVVTLSTGVIAASGNSVSYTGVTSVGTAVLAHGSSTTPAVSVSSAANRRVVAVMGSNNSALAGGKSGFTQTQRYNAGQTSASALVGDAPGAATVSFSATQGSGAWSVIGVDLIP